MIPLTKATWETSSLCRPPARAVSPWLIPYSKLTQDVTMQLPPNIGSRRQRTWLTEETNLAFAPTVAD